MDVRTKLIILHIDFKNGAQKCLLNSNGELPCQKVPSGYHPIRCCSDIMSEYLEIETDWVTFALVDIDIEENILYVYYTCMIPSVVKNLKSEWYDIGSIDNGNIQKMVFEAGQKLLSRF